MAALHSFASRHPRLKVAVAIFAISAAVIGAMLTASTLGSEFGRWQRTQRLRSYVEKQLLPSAASAAPASGGPAVPAGFRVIPPGTTLSFPPLIDASEFGAVELIAQPVDEAPVISRGVVFSVVERVTVPSDAFPGAYRARLLERAAEVMMKVEDVQVWPLHSDETGRLVMVASYRLNEVRRVEAHVLETGGRWTRMVISSAWIEQAPSEPGAEVPASDASQG